jgi:DNA (cytosine-5)-methyltransferase 1
MESTVQEQPRIVDLFCGCGGFSFGAHSAGLKPVLAIDIDPILASSFEANFPDTKLVSADVSSLDGQAIQQKAGGRVAGVFGGPPCQGFSSIGRRSDSDPRRDLLGHFFRIVSELTPSFFVMENVPGLGFADARAVLDRGLELLPARYKIVGPMILDAADFGAATRRPRLFVIGYDPQHFDALVESDFEDVKEAPSTVRAAIADLACATRLPDIGDFDRWQIRRRGRPSAYAASLHSPDRTFTGHQATAHTAEVKRRFKRLQQGETDKVGRHPRLAWNGQCPTLRAGTGNDRGSYQSVRPIHPEEARVITVREAARLQGFPDRFQFHPTIWHSFRMIGNSVSPIVAKAIFSLIGERLHAQSALPIAAE